MSGSTLASFVDLNHRAGARSGREAAGANTEAPQATFHMDVTISSADGWRRTAANLPTPPTCLCLGELFVEMVREVLTGAGGRATVRFYHGDTWITLYEGKPHDSVLAATLHSDRKSLPEEFTAFQGRYNTSIEARIIVPWSDEPVISGVAPLQIMSDCRRDAIYLYNLLRLASEPTNETTADVPRSLRDSGSHPPDPSRPSRPSLDQLRAARQRYFGRDGGQPGGPASHAATAGPAPTPPPHTGSAATLAEFGEDTMLHDVQETISNLVEANPPSNATALDTAIAWSGPAPPASENAIAKVERRAADEKMRAEGCGICWKQQVEEMLVLPCEHWSCEECITTWLRTSGACPFCRRPIEATSETPYGLDVRTTVSGGMQIMSWGGRNMHMSNVHVGRGIPGGTVLRRACAARSPVDAGT